MKKLNLLSTILSVCIPLSVKAQGNYKNDPAYTRNISEWMEEYAVPALGIGIIENGEITYLKQHKRLL